MKYGILYYTCNTHQPDIELACRKQLDFARGDIELGCISLAPVKFGDWQIVLPLERSPLSMHRQILAGLERSDADVVYFCESDVLYHSSHFEFIPPRQDVFYYNINLWKFRYEDGFSVKVDFCQQVSGICAYRDLLLTHYRKRVARIETEGFSRKMGYEPGTKPPPNGIDNYEAISRTAEYPNIDIRHGKTLTANRWSPDQFRNQRFTKGWTERQPSAWIEGWGTGYDILEMIKGSAP